MFSERLVSLNAAQRELVDLPPAGRIFLEGPAGSGKTSAAVERLLSLMTAGVPGSSILVLTPQRTLAEPYARALRHPGVTAGGTVNLATLGGLAQRMVDLYWPLVGELAGFAHPDQLPVFLTLETAQYYMAHLVRPLLEQGYFSSLVIERNRLFSQLLDNLNKAALVGFPISEAGERLKEAWIGEPSQRRVYDDAQDCIQRFRQFCLAHNLLDFSLQVEVFRDLLWPSGLCRDNLQHSYHHLIVDNLEEDTPVLHDILSEWLPELDSALLVYDYGGGYRRFLGADPVSAYRLKDACEIRREFHENFDIAPGIEVLSRRLEVALQAVPAAEELESYPPQGLWTIPSRINKEESARQSQLLRRALSYQFTRYYPQMLDWVAGQVARLVLEEQVSPQEIVILAPYLPDALRFSLLERLERLGIPARSHRPSRSLREEPVTQCLLTLSCLAHPGWGIVPGQQDVSSALVQAIDDLDRVRAQLLTLEVYPPRQNVPQLGSFEQLSAESRQRIGYRLGERYEQMRQWLEQASAGFAVQSERYPYDHFLSRLFGELLSQPGFGFHQHLAAGEITANLVESVQKFRWVAGDVLTEEGIPLGMEYLRMVQDGVIAAQYMRSWQPPQDAAVLISPAYTFLLSNRPAAYQFWLDVGSHGWAERLEQPLTQPYVLSREWRRGRQWTDSDELSAGQQVLQSLATGLVRRCRKGIFLGFSELGETGYEQRGPLLQIFQRLLRQLTLEAGDES